MSNFIYSLEPTTIVAVIGAVLVGLSLLFLLAPKWGCGGLLAIIVIGLLFATKNGALAIMGGIIALIVFIVIPHIGNSVNINVEGDGNNIWIGGHHE